MRIVVIAGPPCSGKSTLVETIGRPSDIALDFDVFARAMGSPVEWIHPEPWRTRAELEMEAAIGRSHAMPGDGTVWVIRAAARPRQRARLAEAWQAPVYVLNPGKAECLRRARDNGRPTGTSRSISEWYFRYCPWAGDRDPAALHPAWANPPDLSRGMVAINPADV